MSGVVAVRVILRAARVACAVALLAACSQASRLDARCVSGDVAVCTELGDMYASGRGVPRDLGRAAGAYQRACDGGVADVCTTLGEVVERMDPAEGGLPRAEQLFTKACDLGSAHGCLRLGLLAAAREDKTRALSLYQKSCDGGWAPGCHQLALTYEQGDGVAKDVPKALALYSQACDDESVESCVAAGTLYLGGEAVVVRDLLAATRLYGKALSLYKEGCEAGNQPDCTEQDRMRTRLAVISTGQVPVVK